MVATGRKAEESAKTRTAILDATETIMREEGYASVTTRRISEQAGVNLGLIHYHFGTLDDVFLALFHRVDDQHLARYEGALAADDPVQVLWEAHNDSAGNALIFEFMALANHRKEIRREIARSVDRVRSLQVRLLQRILRNLGLKPDEWPPVVLSLLLAGASRAIATEATIGVSTGHAETLAFVKHHLRRLKRTTSLRTRSQVSLNRSRAAPARPRSPVKS
jgi:AcrR family transcriptional regulator